MPVDTSQEGLVQQKQVAGLRTDDVRQQDASGSKSRLPRPEGPAPDCPRCGAGGDRVKFAYYNNKCLDQPRYYCKSCQRHWTAGGSMRQVQAGAGRRRTRKKGNGDDDPSETYAPSHAAPSRQPDRGSGQHGAATATNTSKSDASGLSGQHEVQTQAVSNSAGARDGHVAGVSGGGAGAAEMQGDQVPWPARAEQPALYQQQAQAQEQQQHAWMASAAQGLASLPEGQQGHSQPVQQGAGAACSMLDPDLLGNPSWDANDDEANLAALDAFMNDSGGVSTQETPWPSGTQQVVAEQAGAKEGTCFAAGAQWPQQQGSVLWQPRHMAPASTDLTTEASQQAGTALHDSSFNTSSDGKGGSSLRPFSFDQPWRNTSSADAGVPRPEPPQQQLDQLQIGMPTFAGGPSAPWAPAAGQQQSQPLPPQRDVQWPGLRADHQHMPGAWSAQQSHAAMQQSFATAQEPARAHAPQSSSEQMPPPPQRVPRQSQQGPASRQQSTLPPLSAADPPAAPRPLRCTTTRSSNFLPSHPSQPAPDPLAPPPSRANAHLEDPLMEVASKVHSEIPTHVPRPEHRPRSPPPQQPGADNDASMKGSGSGDPSAFGQTGSGSGNPSSGAMQTGDSSVDGEPAPPGTIAAAQQAERATSWSMRRYARYAPRLVTPTPDSEDPLQAHMARFPEANEPGGGFPGMQVPPTLPEAPQQELRERQSAGRPSQQHAHTHSDMRQQLELQQREEREEHGRGGEPAAQANTMAVQRRTMQPGALDDGPSAHNMRSVYQDPQHHSTCFRSGSVSPQQAGSAGGGSGHMWRGYAAQQQGMQHAPVAPLLQHEASAALHEQHVRAMQRNGSRSAPSCTLDSNVAMRHGSQGAAQGTTGGVSQHTPAAAAASASPHQPQAAPLHYRSGSGSASAPALCLPPQSSAVPAASPGVMWHSGAQAWQAGAAQHSHAGSQGAAYHQMPVPRTVHHVPGNAFAPSARPALQQGLAAGAHHAASLHREPAAFPLPAATDAPASISAAGLLGGPHFSTSGRQ